MSQEAERVSILLSKAEVFDDEKEELQRQIDRLNIQINEQKTDNKLKFLF